MAVPIPFAKIRDKGVMRTLHMLAGPIGWAIAGVWTAFYRVTVPAAVYIAALRKMKKEGAALSAAERGEA